LQEDLGYASYLEKNGAKPARGREEKGERCVLGGYCLKKNFILPRNLGNKRE